MNAARDKALRFVIGLGIVSLFADFTYEGGRSILGPYLAILGASSLFVGAVGGLGEFLGYVMRLFSGRFVDRTHRHWQVMAAGYAVNLLSVPLLALAGNPWFAGFLVFSERLGKGARVPPRDALLSRAGRELGHGFAFGLHEALDKTGAVLGPLMVAAAVAWSGYRLGFAILVVPAFMALLFLLRARGIEPEHTHKHAVAGDVHFDARYYLYLAFSVISVFGFAQYILVAYHLEVTHRLAPALIPVLYGLAMGVDALAAVLGGRIFDRHGLKVLIVLPLLSLPAVPLLVLSSAPAYIWLGAVFWGAALGVQQSTVRAGVATLTPEHKRGTAYGIFDSAFGLALLLGSMLLGELYGQGAAWLVGAAVAFQVAALPLLFLVLRPRAKR